MKFSIFVVDDDRHYARMLSYRLEQHPDYVVRTFRDGDDVLAHLDERPDLVLLDVMMPGTDGLEVLRRIRRERPWIPVVMVSAQGAIDVAVEAMKLGAYDYITKGQDDLIKLELVVRNVVERCALAREVEQLRGEVAGRYGIEGLVGDSGAMEKVYRLVHKALRGDLTVAVQGESGTGKELVARAIHYNSERRHGPFVVVNCAAIPRDLMESEFFGHEKGAFTGAHARKTGRFEQADGGTIFLDEIGELDLELQAKLLRALQHHEIQRVGGHETIHFDARVICATNRDIIGLIRQGRFREDLYYRLFQFPIHLPPLRERGQDVLLLAHHFFRTFLEDHPEFAGKRLSPRARRLIAEYAWPGNVRELKSAVERGILISEGEEVEAADLMLNDRSHISPWAERVTLAEAAERVHQPPQPAGGGASIESPQPEVPGGSGIVALEELKRQAVEQAYRLCDGNVDRAAVELGIGRATLYRLLKKYGLMG